MSENQQQPLVLAPGEGRVYDMGRMSAVFKADLDETGSALSVSEWWLDARSEGPHLHQHDEAHMFYVIEGVLSVYLEGRGWFEAAQGSYVYIPGQTEHGFENQGDARAGFISINTPGGFETMLPRIVGFLDEHPIGDAPDRT